MKFPCAEQQAKAMSTESQTGWPAGITAGLTSSSLSKFPACCSEEEFSYHSQAGEEEAEGEDAEFKGLDYMFRPECKLASASAMLRQVVVKVARKGCQWWDLWGVWF